MSVETGNQRQFDRARHAKYKGHQQKGQQKGEKTNEYFFLRGHTNMS